MTVQPTVRLRLDCGYDGTAFSGWARQPGVRTVQQAVEEALATALRLPEVRLTAAGRTDAGVHARGQVCHADVAASAWAAATTSVPRRGRARSPRSDVLPVLHTQPEGAGDPPDLAATSPSRGGQPSAARDLLRRLRGLLPPDVRVSAVSVAPPAFDARFSALWRRYTYRLTDEPAGPDPLRRFEVVMARSRLDVAAMDAAAGRLVGRHDFAAFCRARPNATTVRTLLECSWQREGGVLEARVVADAFCHSMVRALVGACLAVGEGRRAAGWPAAVLAAHRRDPAVMVAPAHGLTLEEVGYPPVAELAAQAEAARARRRLDEP